MSEFSKFPVIFSDGTSPVAFWSQHAKDNLSGFDWLTLNWAKICFVTHSSCQEVLQDFQSFSHIVFLLTLKKRNHALPETNYPNSQKVCSWLGIFNPQEFMWGFILANPHVHAAQRISKCPLAQVAKLSKHHPLCLHPSRLLDLSQPGLKITRTMSGKVDLGNAQGPTYWKCSPITSCGHNCHWPQSRQIFFSF